MPETETKAWLFMHNEVIREVETGGQQVTAEWNQDNEIRREVKIKVAQEMTNYQSKTGMNPKDNY